MFSDDLYKRLIKDHEPTVEDKYGVHFEYDDLCSRLLQVKHSQSKSSITPQLPGLTKQQPRRRSSTDKYTKRAASLTQLKSSFTLDLQNRSPVRAKQLPVKAPGSIYRTISYKAFPMTNRTARRTSEERISAIYGKGIKRGKKITLRK